MEAPGAPGIPPTRTSRDKDMVGTVLGPARPWFTVGHSILNEVALPVLLAAARAARDALGGIEARDTARWALAYLVAARPHDGAGPPGGDRRDQPLHAGRGDHGARRGRRVSRRGREG